MPKSLRCKIKKLCYNGALTERERDRILKALDQENVIQQMRDATEEERKSVKDYIESISKPPGVQFEAYPFINKPCISEGVCREDKMQALDKMKAEIKEWYWQADKQALAKDPCVVDAMIDLFIRTIDRYKTESEE